jgi:hypothetical protein
MKRLGQGHLLPKLEVLGLKCPDRESNPTFMVGGEQSRKEPFEQLVNSYSEHLQMSPRQFQNYRHMALCVSQLIKQEGSWGERVLLCTVCVTVEQVSLCVTLQSHSECSFSKDDMPYRLVQFSLLLSLLSTLPL